jgi:Lrp/AsnC family transcriptional regulator for asnA, asnC and gidA
MVLTEKDREILDHFRKNARKKITDIAKEVNIPATTIYDKLRSFHTKGIITKHSTIIDFSKLGYQSLSIILFDPNPEKRNSLKDYLSSHPNVNSLYRADYDKHFITECVFEDYEILNDFVKDTDKRFNSTSRIFNIHSKPKNEEFMRGTDGTDINVKD